MNINRENTLINCYCSIGVVGESTRFLIDTGAEVSLLKIDKARRDIVVKEDEAVGITGINVGSFRTFGTSQADVIIDGNILHHKFQLIRKCNETKYDGILGHDFLRKFGVHIKFSETNKTHIQITKEIPDEIDKNQIKEVTKERTFEVRETPTCYSGLENDGNNCFLNSVVQALNGVSKVRAWVEKVYKKSQLCKDSSCTRCSFVYLCKALEENQNSLTIKCHQNQLRSSISELEANTQHDAQECLSFLLSKTCKSISHTEKLSDVLTGKIDYQTFCTNCGKNSIVVQEFQELNLYPIEGHTVQQIIDLEYGVDAKTTVEGKCGICFNSKFLIRKNSIQEVSSVLVLKINLETIGNYKIVKNIQPDRILELPVRSRDVKNKTRFKLSSMILHKGNSVDSGHYVAKVCSEGNSWINYDDDKVQVGSCEDSGHHLVSENETYMLFYELIDYESPSLINFTTPLVEQQFETVCIPARSQTCVRISVDRDGDFVCKARDIGSGMLIANSIFTAKKGIGIVSVMNVDVLDKHIDTLNLDLVELDEFEVVKDNVTTSKNSDRLDELLKHVKLTHLNDWEKSGLIDILEEYNDLFTLEKDSLTFCDFVQHKIPVLQDSKAINVRPYRLPIAQREEIKNQISKMKDDGLIRPSKSAWNAPLLLVPKKLGPDGKRKWRIVVDFRKLNEVTISDSFPLPNIVDILDQLGHSKYFTTLDLSAGYHQVEVADADREKTAFSTGFEHLEWVRMPMGLKSAGHTFQRLMNAVLTGLQGIDCFVYLDDIVIYASSLEDHACKMHRVFRRLRESNLKLQPEKCNFLRKEVVYLGHLITEDGIQPDPTKVTSIQNLVAPTTPKGIKSFLGMIGYYRRFIPDFAEKAKPLTELLKKAKKFKWDENCQKSFQQLKNKIIEYPILRYPNFEEKFNITTDASAIAISAVLSQGPSGKDLPIAFASRTLLSAETRYSTSEQELLAIVWGIEHFRPYLYGKKFNIYTDHKPLVYLMNVKDPNSRLMRWKLRLSTYEFEIIHTKGKDNKVADYLSRSEPAIVDESIFKDSLEFEGSSVDVVTRSSRQKADFRDETSKPSVQDIISDQPRFIDFTTRKASRDVPNTLSFGASEEPWVSKCGGDVRKGEVYVEKKGEGYKFILIDRTRIEEDMDFSSLKRGIHAFKLLCVKLDIVRILIDRTRWFKGEFRSETVKSVLLSEFKDIPITFYWYKDEIEKLIDRDKINLTIKEFHELAIGGHQGRKRTFDKIRSRFQWNGMKDDIEQFIKKCDKCQKNKHSQKTKMPLQITTTAKRPFENIALDIVGPLNDSSGYFYLLTFQDNLTKFVGAIPLENQEADTVARAFVEHVVLRYGIPMNILTDQGTNFLSTLFSNVCKLLKIKKIKSSAYHPETNGSLERSHRTLKEYLRNFVNKSHDNWSELIPYCMFTMNSSKSEATGYSPFELLYGHEVFIPTSLKNKPDPLYNYDDYLYELKYKLQSAHQMAYENQLETKNKRKEDYDKRSKEQVFAVGDKVLLINTSQKGEGRKMQPLYLGPYSIIENVSPVNTKIATGKRHIVVHNNRLKKYVQPDEFLPILDNQDKNSISRVETVDGEYLTFRDEDLNFKPDVRAEEKTSLFNVSDSLKNTKPKLTNFEPNVSIEERTLPLSISNSLKFKSSEPRVSIEEDSIEYRTRSETMSQTFPWTKFSNPNCLKIVLKMGYTPGKGLGYALQGRRNAIVPRSCNKFKNNPGREESFDGETGFRPIKFVKSKSGV